MKIKIKPRIRKVLNNKIIHQGETIFFEGQASDPEETENCKIIL